MRALAPGKFSFDALYDGTPDMIKWLIIQNAFLNHFVPIILFNCESENNQESSHGGHPVILFIEIIIGP